MADLTPQQTQAIQQIATNVEAAHREVTRSRTALSYLIQAGKATCTDIKNYNLIAKSTYFYQKSMSDTIRGAGGQAPVIPDPIYVTYKGVTGDQAANIDCSSGQINGWQPDGLGDYYVNPAQVEWRAGALPSDQQAIAQALAGVTFNDRPGAQLGNPLLAIIPIILYGIVISIVGYIVLKIVEVFKDVPGKQAYTRQVAITAERHRATLEARAKCLADCGAQGKDAIACAKACAKVLPGYEAPSPYGGRLGLLGTVLGGVLLVGIAYLGYRAWTARDNWLPSGGQAGDDDDDDDDAIDVEYAER